MIKSLLKPSLFRRYLLTSITVILVFLAALLAWGFLTSITPEEAESDLAMPARALALLSEDTKLEEIERQGNYMRSLFREFGQPSARIEELQYAVIRGGKVITQSAGAPAEAFAWTLATRPEKTIEKDGWFIKFSRGEKQDSAAIFAMQKSFLQRSQAESLPSALRTILIIIVVTGVVVWIASRFALRPINEMTKRILALDTTRFDQLDSRQQHVELQPVVAAINERTQALRAQIEAERRFFSNAAHELRTPLAVINIQASSIEHAQNAEDLKARVAELQRAVKRAAHALARMLVLARLDSTLTTSEQTSLSLRDAAAESVAFHAKLAFSRNQMLSLVEHCGPSTAVVTGSRDELMSIIDNLVENAIHYAGLGANIIVEIGINAESADQSSKTGGGSSVFLSVTDDGPGFTDSDHTTAFERFRRGSQSECQPGSGLGLAIVKASAERMGGRVIARNVVDSSTSSKSASQRGLCVRVDLPLTP
jgi:two-component system sensor histidine kinase QseC